MGIPDRRREARSRPGGRGCVRNAGRTGVHCATRAALGTRLHPKTGALCAYYLCGHLAGEPANRDPAENAAVTWAPVARLPDFIPTTSVYPPILDALGAAHV